jgi:rfaE bifunctional protein kinase chain/domain
MKSAEILQRFRDLSVLIVGDLCLDRWCTYDPTATEPSRETGIPRVGVVSVVNTPGAAGTVAANLVALGAGRVSILSAFGDDGFGEELRRALGALDVAPELSVCSSAIQTFTYTKLINKDTGEEDQPRVDFINMDPLPASIEQRLVDNLERFGHMFDVIIVSDQAETAHGGIVTAPMREAVSQLALDHPEKVVWVDSRVRCEHYRHAILKPNEREAAEACTRLFGKVDYQSLRESTDSPLVMITRGPEGALVIDAQGERLIPTRGVQKPVDICGAGDSFSAGASMAYRVTGSADDAARIGNLVASVTIMKKGTGTASPKEVLAAESR